ncbi:hypothetical protein KAW65_04975 [candidate division WOR-3 bacterium]|nr:hypothetical protein [candidate division WOR-3 bacterium]
MIWLIIFLQTFIGQIGQPQGLSLLSTGPSGCTFNVAPAPHINYVRGQVGVLIGIPPEGEIKCEGGKIDQFAWIRRHRVARILVKPNKYAKKKISVTWKAVGAYRNMPPQPEVTPFKNLLKTFILNYETSKNWVRQRRPFVPHINYVRDYGKYKILTEQEGLYRISYQNLASIIPEINTIDPRTIKINYYGFEIPIIVKGEDDGSFDTDDWIEFYAKRIKGKNTELNLYSTTNVYWLDYDGAYGARIVSKKGDPGEAFTPTSYPFKIHFEKDGWYKIWESSPCPDTIDPWFWTRISSEESFLLVTPPPSKEGSANIKIKARTDGGAGMCEVFLNGSFIGNIPIGWSGRPDSLKEDISQTVLQDTNELTLKPNVGRVWLNYIELNYSRLYATDNGIIKFKAPGLGAYKFKISGFKSPGIRAWKLGTAVIDGRIEYNDTSLTYTYIFEDTARNENTFYLVQDIIQEPTIIKDTLSDLKSSLNQANYIIITNSELWNCGLNYASWRESQSVSRRISCKVVNIQDIYDEFNFGLPDPEAIKNFLKYAYENWSSPPVYVLLLGDATYDYRNIYGYGGNIVPSKSIYDLRMVLTPSDNYYACIDGTDPVPDILIGRLPVKNEREFNIVFSKLQNYESKINWGEWKKTFIFTAHTLYYGIDSATPTNNIIKKYMSEDYEVKRVYYPALSQPELINVINKGGIFLSFIGHSAKRVWVGEFLCSGAIPGLANINRLPFIGVIGCYNGIFDDPTEEFMGELFIKSPGGAIAYWGPTGYATVDNEELIEGVLQTMLTDSIPTSGSIAEGGLIECFKSGAMDIERVILEQTLLGDPATLIQVPKKMTLRPIPPSLSPGDSITISGNLSLPLCGEGRGEPESGEAILTIITPDSIPFQKIRVPVTDGNFEGKFKLPDTIITGIGRITGYAWPASPERERGKSNSTDFTGSTHFFVNMPCITDVSTIPVNPTKRDSVWIRATVFDISGINKVWCNWSKSDLGPWEPIYMTPDISGYWVTDSTIDPFPPNTRIYFKIDFENVNGNMISSLALFDSLFHYNVLSLPDLTQVGEFKLTGTDKLRIGATIINKGEEPTDSFVVSFFRVDTFPVIDTLWLGDDTLTLNGGESKEVSVFWKNLPELEVYGRVFTIIDPINKIEESDTTNNRYLDIIPVTLFNVSPDSGTNGWVRTLDYKFQCCIDSSSVLNNTVLELKDTVSAHWARFLNPDTTLLKDISLIIHPDSFSQELSIYKWNEKYLHWLLVAPDTIAKTNKLGLFKLASKGDTIPPEIKLDVENGELFYARDIKIKGIISDESGIDFVDRKITITCNGDTLADSLYSYPTDEGSMYELPFILRIALGDGNYTFSFIAYDLDGNRAEKTVTLKVQIEFSLEKWGNYPNPSTDGKTTFYFKFTKIPDEFDLKVYTVAGRFIKTFGGAGFQPANRELQFSWNLKDKNGNSCANGVYFYKFQARKDNKKIEYIKKLAILQ